jgi:hypothetical protein
LSRITDGCTDDPILRTPPRPTYDVVSHQRDESTYVCRTGVVLLLLPASQGWPASLIPCEDDAVRRARPSASSHVRTGRIEVRSNPMIVAGSQPGSEDYHCNDQARLLTVGMESRSRDLIPLTSSHVSCAKR